MKSDLEKFAVLADPIRLRLFRLLAVCANRVCVCELVDALDVPQYQVSRALTGLRQAGLAEGARDGIWVAYSVPPDVSPLGHGLAALVRDHLGDGPFRVDEARLQARLRFRVAGRCVVGLNDPRVGSTLAGANELPAAATPQTAHMREESVA
jgi:ArsR family transcriptional regulator